MKWIFVTGGVVSSLGKGLTAASIGALLENQDVRISIQKMDPYLNVDPGTMNPCQHGEVYVLNDGSETDLDLGHYERFTNANLSRGNSVSAGQIYETILKKERNGDYLGATVQVIPHVTDEIKRRILSGATNKDVDILITEIGGVVGDIEGLPFLEALRQISQEVGYENVVFIHLTLLPFLKASAELKSKPSQQSVAKLREIGIQPDILICRTEMPIDTSIRQKLSLFCNIPLPAVISEQDITTSVYELPICLHHEHLDQLILSHLNLPYQDKPLTIWQNIMQRIQSQNAAVKIGLIGKYTNLKDAYKSVYEALAHAGIAHYCKVDIRTIDAEQLEKKDVDTILADLQGILIPGGFGSRGTEGKIMAIRYAREKQVPFLGICLGMQLAAVEFARNVLCYFDANSTEIDVQTTHPIINLMEEQKKTSVKGATMRLGAQPCQLALESLIYSIYKKEVISERHRHRYEFNDVYAEEFKKHGMNLVGHHAKTHVVEAIELERHPWFIGVQFHPEFQSKPHQPHPLLAGFISACLAYKHQEKM